MRWKFFLFSKKKEEKRTERDFKFFWKDLCVYFFLWQKMQIFSGNNVFFFRDTLIYHIQLDLKLKFFFTLTCWNNAEVFSKYVYICTKLFKLCAYWLDCRWIVNWFGDYKIFKLINFILWIKALYNETAKGNLTGWQKKQKIKLKRGSQNNKFTIKKKTAYLQIEFRLVHPFRSVLQCFFFFFF